jgi:dextranase
MNLTTTIRAVTFDKAFYYPGQPVHVTVQLDSSPGATRPAWLVVEVIRLFDILETSRYAISLTGGLQEFSITLTPPDEAPRGYGLELSLETEDTADIARASTAFDVLNHWTEHPRYGFLSEFDPGRTDSEETMEILSGYHVNALQFYDWMYRHEQLLPEAENYIDLLGRSLSLRTVNALIDAAHERNIAAMPYTAVYGSSVAFLEEHPEWAVLNRRGQPVLFGEDFMAIMDPRPDSPWTKHLLAQFEELLKNTQFDGIHLDQYGDPKEGYTSSGERYDLAPALASFIDATREVTDRHRKMGAVVFNAVTNWPIEAVAPAGQDIVYIEVWPPYDWFSNLGHLIVEGQSLGNGKPVVLAAYIDPAHEHNVRIIDAIIFSNGGGHIELGERSGSYPGMLADPYFPKFQPLTPELAEAVRRMYRFSVRYQEIIGPGTSDATQEYQNRIQIEGVSTAPGARKDKVMPVARASGSGLAISLINLAGVEQTKWKAPIDSPPTHLQGLRVEISGIDRQTAGVWLASPDGHNLAGLELNYTHQNGVLTFEVPSLMYWDLIFIEWSK